MWRPRDLRYQSVNTKVLKTRAKCLIYAQVLRSSPIKVQALLLYIVITELSVQLKQVQDLLQERKVIKPCLYDLNL